MNDTQIQEVKRHLKSYRILRREEGRLRVRLADLERMLRLPALRKKGMEPAEVESLAAQRRQELLDLMERTLERCREIEDLIGRIEGNEEDRTYLYRQILGMRYLDGLFFSEIAGRLHYHERHVRRLHREALEAVVVLWEGGKVHGVE